ncbi:MAG: hypothetical protein RLZZ384_1261 [Pseudomonadota bacterium]|jgi:N-ethylmaleimide reductase
MMYGLPRLTSKNMEENVEHLFKPLQIGALTLPNRIVMAPLTRCRADEGHHASNLMAAHYAKRASAGLIIAEATMVMEGNSAFWKEPAIYSASQVDAWKKVTDAVHEQGGHIFLQIWHGGRACHPLINDGQEPVAPSAIAITSSEVLTPEGWKPYVTPRELRDDEIPAIVEGFKHAAQNAKAAGFDGVEVHGANGYLIDEFLRDGANKRTGAYGGSIENRARFMLEVLEAVCDVWGCDRVGLRISPLNSFNSMVDSDPIALSIWLAKKLNAFNLAYLHVMRSDFFQVQQGDVLTPIREHYQGVLISNMGYSPKEAEEAISQGLVDAVAFGVPFIANADLPEKIKSGTALNQANPDLFYTGGAAGYDD